MQAAEAAKKAEEAEKKVEEKEKEDEVRGEGHGLVMTDDDDVNSTWEVRAWHE